MEPTVDRVPVDLCGGDPFLPWVLFNIPSEFRKELRSFGFDWARPPAGPTYGSVRKGLTPKPRSSIFIEERFCETELAPFVDGLGVLAARGRQ